MGCHREFQLGRESDCQDIVEIIKQIYDQSSFLEIKQIKILFSLQKTEFTVGNTGIIIVIIVMIGRRGGLMVSALDSGANGPGSSPGRGHCVVFLGKTLYSHSASLHPGV